MTTNKKYPEWAPRLRKDLIKRLYDNDSLGIYDLELIDKVGFGLLSRCQSFIQAVQASRGTVTCPTCGSKIPHNRDKESILRCDLCGWELSWGDYFATIQHKQLSGAEPVLNLFSSYIDIYPKLTSPKEKMLQIDHLIHGFHYFFKNNLPTRPVAVNLIKGRLKDVIIFLDSLSNPSSATPELQDSHNKWKENIEISKKKIYS